MAGKSASILVKILGDESGINKALGSAESKLAAFSAKAQAVGDKMKDVGKTMSLAVTLPIVAVGAASFKMAADLQDAMGATKQIYGDAGKDVEAWAKKLPTYYGIARGEAHEYANMMGAMLTNIGGLTQDEAAKQSAKLVEMAGDLTAMFGGTTESAVQALTGALKGNTTMLDNYGMSATDAQQKAKALEMGIWDGAGTMDSATKQAAILALVTEQSGAAQGQAAREAEGASGQMRSLMTEMKNLGTEIGTKLLPIGVKVLGMVAGWIEKFKGLDERARTIIMVVAGVVAAIGPLVYIGGILATAIGFIASPIGLVVLGLTALVAAFAYFYKTNEGFREWVNNLVSVIKEKLIWVFTYFKDEVLPKVAAAIQWVADVIIPKIMEGFSWFSTKIQPVLTSFGELAEAVFANTGEALKILGSIIGTIVTAAAAAFEWLQPVITVVWGMIVNSIDAAIKMVHGIIKTVTALLKGDWAGVWDGIKMILGAAWDSIKGTISGALNIIIMVVTGALGWISGVVSGAWTWIAGLFSGGINAAKNFVREGLDHLVSYFTGMPGRITRAAGDLFGGISGAFKAAINWVIDKWNDLSFTMPSVEVFGNKIGGGSLSTPNIPRLHTGGYAGGLKPNEVPAILEAGESVRSRDQEARLQSILGSIGQGGSGGATVIFQGPVSRDSERWVVDMVENAVARGHQMPQLRKAMS